MKKQNFEQEVKEQKAEIEKLKKRSGLQRWINLWLIWSK